MKNKVKLSYPKFGHGTPISDPTIGFTFLCVINLFNLKTTFPNIQKQPSGGVPEKKCSENMQQIYRSTHMPKYDFNKVAKQLY